MSVSKSKTALKNLIFMHCLKSQIVIQGQQVYFQQQKQLSGKFNCSILAFAVSQMRQSFFFSKHCFNSTCLQTFW